MIEKYIHGLDGVESRLILLGDGRAAKRAATRSTRKVMAVVRKAAIANAKRIDDPETSEKIWKNIMIKAGRISGENVMMKLGVRGGARHYVNSKDNMRKDLAGKKYLTNGDKTNPGGDTFYWWYVELGTEHIVAEPFMRPALQNNIGNVTNEFASVFSADIDKELAKL